MFCTKCGTNLADDAIFCHKCGRQVPSQSSAAETSQIANNLPQPDQQVPAATTTKRISAIKSAWKGNERLWKVFWIYFVFGTFVIWFMQKVALSIESAGALNNVLGRLLTILFGVLTTTYFVWVITSLWMCAFNSGSRALGYLSRALVIWVFVSFLGILASIALQHK